MFDISLSEMLVVAVVAVVVVGPKRLPATVRTVARVVGRAQRYVSDIKADIEREMEVEEIRNLKKSVTDIGKDIESSMRKVTDNAQNVATDIQKSASNVGYTFTALQSDINDTLAKTEKDQNLGNAENAPDPTVPKSLLGEVELSAPVEKPQENVTKI